MFARLKKISLAIYMSKHIKSYRMKSFNNMIYNLNAI
jgi:hypothetical protein